MWINPEVFNKRKDKHFFLKIKEYWDMEKIRCEDILLLKILDDILWLQRSWPHFKYFKIWKGLNKWLHPDIGWNMASGTKSTQ